MNKGAIKHQNQEIECGFDVPVKHFKIIESNVKSSPGLMVS